MIPCFALLAVLLPLPALAQTSAYTDLRGPPCRSTGVEGTFDCPGPRGHALRIEGEGASDSLTLLLPPRAEEHPLWPPPGPDFPNGATSVGSRMEGGRSRLEVYALGEGRACWVANLAGAGGNARARHAADESRGTCR